MTLILGSYVYADSGTHDRWYVTCINNSQYTITLQRSGDCTGDAYWDENFYTDDSFKETKDEIVIQPGATEKFITREDTGDDPGTLGHEDKFMNLKVLLNQESTPRAIVFFKEHVQSHFPMGGKRETHAAIKDGNGKVIRDNYRIHTNQPTNFTIKLRGLNIDEHPYIEDFISFYSAGESELDFTIKNQTNEDMVFWTGDKGKKIKVSANKSRDAGLTMNDGKLNFHCSLASSPNDSVADYQNNDNNPTTRITDLVIQKTGDNSYRVGTAFNLK